eukprot:jgi/Botrbrau1/9976/Bobra.0012s0070.1
MSSPNKTPVDDSGLEKEEARQSIWVGVRLRPLSDTERLGGEQSGWRVPDSTTLEWMESGRSGPTAPTLSTFTFDQVFPAASSSLDVYENAAKDKVLTALAGINATIFVYGPTGSGKTYTMRAFLQQACKDIFKVIESTDHDFLLRVSALEIYNERVRDLLKDNSGQQNLTLHDEPEKGTVVDGLSEEGISSTEHLLTILEGIEQRRMVRDTRTNVASSRSHQIVKIYIESRPPAPYNAVQNSEHGQCSGSQEQERSTCSGEDDDYGRPVTSASLCFVDLAGSERSAFGTKDEVGDVKLRQTEGGAINKSLLTLGNVIRALSEGKARVHVPFRDSKLTRVLQGSLGGNSRTAIITCISPAKGSNETTRAALTFSLAAKRVAVFPCVNKTISSKAEIRLLQEEIAILRRQLADKHAHIDTAHLSAVLVEKQKEIEMTSEQRDLAQKRLRNLEQLILGGQERLIQRRNSWSIPGTNKTSCSSGGKTEAQGRVRSSWHPSARKRLEPYLVHSTPSQVSPNIGPDSPESRSSDAVLNECVSHSPNFLSMAYEETLKGKDKPAHAIPQGPEENDQEGIHQRLATTALESLQQTVHLLTGVQQDSAVSVSHSGPLPTWVRFPSGHNLQSPGKNNIEELFDPSYTSLVDSPSNITEQDTACSVPGTQEQIVGPSAICQESDATSSLQGGLPGKRNMHSPVCMRQSAMTPAKENAGVNQMSVRYLLDHDVASNNNRRPFVEKANETPERTPSSLAHFATSCNFNAPADDQTRMSPEGSLFWYKTELRRIQASLKDEVERDVTSLKSALRQYDDQVQRLECQKQLLLKQVLELEVRVSESSCKTEEYIRQLQEANAEILSLRTLSKELEAKLLKAQRDLASAQRVKLESSMKDGSPPGTPIPAHLGNIHRVPMLKLQGDVPVSMLDADNSWGAPPSAETLLPRIMDLWELLSVPLVHRSRFFIAFQGRETFYFEAEHRRLSYLRSQMVLPDDGSPENHSACPALIKARRKLEWERKWLAQQFKWDFTPEEREDMFLQWNVHRDSKERKLQLLRRVWSPGVVREADGPQRSSELVLRLNGTEATDGMFEMVFGRNEGNEARWGRTAASMIGPVGGLIKAVASPMRSSMVRESSNSGITQRKRSILSAVSGLAGQLTPRKAQQPCRPESPSVWTPTNGTAAWNAVQDSPP